MRNFRYVWGGLLVLSFALWLFGYPGEKAFIVGIPAALLLVATECLLGAQAMDIELAREWRGEIPKARHGKGTMIALSVVGSLIGMLGVLTLVVAIVFVIAF